VSCDHDYTPLWHTVNPAVTSIALTTIIDVIFKTRAQLSLSKGVTPNALWYTGIFGLQAYNLHAKIIVVRFP